MDLEPECLVKQVDKFLSAEGQKAEKRSQHNDQNEHGKFFITSVKKYKHFNIVNNLGVKFFSKYFIIISLKLKSEYRGVFLGIKASKKISNKAVVRNKVKRRIRHLMRIVIQESCLFANPSKQNYSLHLIFIPKVNFEQINFQYLKYILLNYFIKKLTLLEPM